MSAPHLLEVFAACLNLAAVWVYMLAQFVSRIMLTLKVEARRPNDGFFVKQVLIGAVL